MKLIVKSLSGKKIEIEIEEESTVRELKEVIEKEQNSMKADSLKLVAYGKVLDDDSKKLASDHALKNDD